MKKVLSILAVSGFVLTGGSCLAADGSAAGPVYVKVLGSYVMMNDPEIRGLQIESDNGYGLGAAVGMHFNQFRLEAEFATQKTDIDAISTNSGLWLNRDAGDVRRNTYMVNAYYDFPVSEGFGIYVTAGIGYGTANFNIYNIDDDDSGLAWKGGAGISYTINSNMTVDLGWEYVGMEDAEFDLVTVSDIYSNNIVGAFRYRF